MDDIGRFLVEHGFREHVRHRLVFKTGVGSYYEVVYKRVEPAHHGVSA